MKKLIKGVLVALFILIIAVSCSFSEKEADVSTTVDTPTLIYGKANALNSDIVGLQTFEITLHGGTLNKDITGNTDLSTWLMAESNIFSSPGKYSIKAFGKQNEGSDKIRLYFDTGANAFVPTKASQDKIKLQIPADYIQVTDSNKDRLSAVEVNTGNLKYYVIDEKGELPYATFTTGKSVASGGDSAHPFGYLASWDNDVAWMSKSVGTSLDDNPYPLVIELTNVSFNEIKDQTDITSWFSPSIKGLKYTVDGDVQKGARSLKLFITGTIEEPKKTQKFSAKIPASYLSIGKDLACFNTTRIWVNITGSTSDYSAESTTIDGTVTLHDGDETPVDKTITITSDATTFKQVSSATTDNAKSWFSPVVEGLTYTQQPTTEKDTYTKVRIYGYPKTSLDAPFTITVPSTATNGTSDAVKGEFRYNIKKSKKFAYAWELFDLASYTNTSVNVENVNKNLTNKADGSALTFGDNNKIAEGQTQLISFADGLSRRGYKLKGLARLVNAKVDLENIIPCTDIVTGVALSEADKGDVVHLYAVWAVDPEAWGWTVNADGTYQKTQDTSDGGKYFPVTFDLNKAYSGDENAERRTHYVDYPYYKEAKILSKGLKAPIQRVSSYVDADDYEFTYDFMIAEQVFTGYQLDVLREWNKGTGSDDAPEKGYDIPIEFVGTFAQTKPTAADNKVGYGSFYNSSSSSYISINDKSQPVVFITVTQAMVISNALTSYYNEKKGLSAGDDGFLTPAYTSDRTAGGTEIKKLADATTLYESVTTNYNEMRVPNSTGFRLPTNEEWSLAARIVPENDYKEELTGAHSSETGTAVRNYLYPQISRSDMLSGADTIGYTAEVVNQYAWYYYNSGVNFTSTTPSTHGFVETQIAEGSNIIPGTVLAKKMNRAGVYGMSGNVWEWCDSVVNTTARRLRGGSFANYASYVRVGYLNFNYASARYGRFGVRFVRAL